ncbi:MAG: ribonuclease Z [Paenibacillus macerans]|uniref:Ribonuclease Z n=1 Tax=Paenibacillus macerans TaxID=44252 RepID=A0A090ZEA2_PAEMA|nr:ribonuclease Z [Paenibacillus macerans]KFN08763.1 ribonuclease Z [Paenibacillus macerans]MBS5913665.1 ribonuclease Z [Paenibacillus macerans]MCY7562167.1 ribonuclease Z [Paenibacillus macerans]MDU7474324.1 ribonuclease Z [Paenibacillus macerans]MEC0139281.1 ribonuclease Z [Paenibacillus macerans]
MELYFLGTNAGVPSLERNVTSLALRLLEERRSLWLFDCGEGTQHQILRSPLKLSKLEYIFITHLHGDHLFGLPGLISSRAYQGGDSPLTIFGPKGLKKFVETTLGLSESRIDYKLEIVEHDGGLLFEDDTFRVEAALLEHRIASYGYRVVEKDLPGKLDAAVLERFGIRPGPLYGKLKKGESVVTPSGETLYAVDVLGKPKAGRVVTILGDTRPCSAAQKLAQNADVLVHESTFLHELADTAHAYHHSTARQAAKTARDAGAQHLFLTHFSSRYKSEEQLGRLEDEAKAVFAGSELAREHVLYPVRRRCDRES